MGTIRLTDLARLTLAILLIGVIVLSVVLPVGVTQAATKYDYYELGDDSANLTYGQYWFAHSFTATTTYSASQVILKYYRTGSPSTLTLYLTTTDSDGLPDSVLASGSPLFDLDSLTTDTGGQWAIVYMTPNVVLTQGIKYAIVMVVDGDSSNYLAWRKNSAGAYSGGSSCYSLDGGINWASTADDFMFQVWGTLTTSTLYEYYNTGDDNVTDNVWGDNWTAQTFLTSTTPHSIDRVRLKLQRQGAPIGVPGTVTVSIRATDNTGQPTGSDLASGTIDGNTVDNSSDDWYYIPFTSSYYAHVDTTYAIVLRCASDNQDAGNIVWSTVTAGGYANGTLYTSPDAGTNWADTSRDAMFEIYGAPLLAISDVAVFSDYMESGDWLITILHLAKVPPAYPGGTPYLYFNLCLSNGAGTYYAKVGLMQWEYAPGSIYLSADTVSGLGITWGTACQVSIEPVTGMWDTDPVDITYNLVSADWLGTNKLLLDDWVRDTAQDIEDYYTDTVGVSVDLYTETVGDETFPSGLGVLTTAGAELFLEGIPSLDAIRPNLFIATSGSVDIPYREKSSGGINNAATVLGTTVMNTLTALGGVINIDGTQMGALLLFLGVVLTVNYLAKVSGDVRLPLAGGAIMVVVIGWWTGLMSYAFIAIVIMILATFLVWKLFWAST